MAIMRINQQDEDEGEKKEIVDYSGRQFLFEDILDRVGDIGCCQLLCLLAGSLADMTVNFSFVFFIFEGLDPGYTCLLVDRNTSEPLNWTENACPTEEYDCINVTYKDTFTSITTEWNFGCEKKYMVKLTTTIYFIGVLLGSTMGSLSDHFGRKRVFVSVWMMMGIFQASLGLAPNWTVYVILKFITGFFAGPTCATSTMLPVDYFGIKWRRLQATFVGWGVGMALVGLLAYLIPNWRQLAIACGLFPTIFAIIFIFVLPESARWHIQRGEYELALRNLKLVAKLNGRTPPPKELIAAVGKSEQGNEGLAKRYTIKDMFKTKEMAKITITQMFASFGNSIVHYGLAMELGSLVGSVYVNLALSGIFGVVTGVTPFYFLEKIGRRYCLPLYMTIPIVTCYLLMAVEFSGTTTAETAKSVLAVISISVMSAVWNVCGMIFLESYPTLIRSTAGAVMATSTRVGGILSPTIALLANVKPGLHFLVFGTVGLTELVSMFLVVPETRGKPLIETIMKTESAILENENTYISYPLTDNDSSDEEVHFDLSLEL